MAGVPLNSTPGAGRGARPRRGRSRLRASPRRRRPCFHPRPRLGRNAGHRGRAGRAALRPRQRARGARGHRPLAPPGHRGPRQPLPRPSAARSSATPARCSAPSACATRSTGSAAGSTPCPATHPSIESSTPGSRALTDSLANAQKRTEAARVELDRARTQFIERSESLRARIRHWEDSTYRGYDSITRNLAVRRRQDPRTDTTRRRRVGPLHAAAGTVVDLRPVVGCDGSERGVVLERRGLE